ncbi:TonB-dependent receptor [Sunxiuqinia sp. A32]|uniref:TonB-dependent receptor n=1 Tax=Sunxiuqinia sp. A32 TaxID=3461496 RepID=UPI004045D72C
MTHFKTLFILIPLLFFAILASAQHRIAGTIKDAKTGDPLIGANIYLAGTTYGAASDKEGKYEITNVSDGTYELRVSYKGYQSEQVMLEVYQNKSSVHFRLIENSIDLNAIVVTGTRSEQPISNSPVLTQLIGKKAIAEQSNFTLSQVLTQNNASYEMVKDNTVNSFRFDGLGAQYTLFLLDGERIAGETKGAVDLSRINPATIERIEIVKGAGSTLYGTNAIGGVVNIISRDVSKPIEVNAGIQSSLYKDPSTENNRSEEYAYASVNLTKGKLSSFTDGKYNNYSPYDINGGAGYYGILTQENEFNYNFRQKLIFRPFDQLSLTGNASYYKMERDFQLQDYPDKKSEDLTVGFKTTYAPWEKAKFELSYHSDHNKIYDVLNLGTEKKDTLDYDNLFQNIRFLGNIKIGYFNDVTFGAEYIQEEQSSSQNNIESQKLENYVVYLQNELMINRNLTLIGGVRNEFHSSYGSFFTPQTSILFSPGKFTFRGNYGKGFRAPSVKELYTNQFAIPATGSPIAFFLDGNPDLLPETSEYLSGSAQFSNEKIDVSLSYSMNNIDQLITYDSIANVIMDEESIPPTPQQINYIYSNVEEARINSINLLARYRIFNSLTLSASGAYIEAKDLSNDEILPNVRKFSARLNLNFNHSFGGYAISANLNTNYFGSKKVINIYSETNELVELSDYTLWKLMTTHTLKKHYTLKIGVNNLFNKSDDQPEYFNLTSPGRMLIFGASVNF